MSSFPLIHLPPFSASTLPLRVGAPFPLANAPPSPPSRFEKAQRGHQYLIDSLGLTNLEWHAYSRMLSPPPSSRAELTPLSLFPRRVARNGPYTRSAGDIRCSSVVEEGVGVVGIELYEVQSPTGSEKRRPGARRGRRKLAFSVCCFVSCLARLGL